MILRVLLAMRSGACRGPVVQPVRAILHMRATPLMACH
jgi:hypothetical protein